MLDKPSDTRSISFLMPRIGAALGLFFLIAGLAAPFPGLPAAAQWVLGLTLCGVVCWTLEPVPLEWSALFFLLALPASGLLSFAESFSPFADKTLWLVFAGMVLSQGLGEAGFGQRLAAGWLQPLVKRPFLLLASLHLVGLVAAFLIPSGVVRVMLLVPLGLSLVDSLGGKDDRLLNATVILSLVSSTYYGGAGLLTGTVPNLVVAGQLERHTDQQLFWAQWIQWMFPVFGLLRTGLSLAVLWFLFGRRLQLHPGNLSEPAPLPTSTRQPYRILAVLLLGVLLWATDFLHHIAPAYIALGLVLLLALPGWGPVPLAKARGVNFPFLFYIAALFTLGTAWEVSGLNRHLLNLTTAWVDLSGYSAPQQLFFIVLVNIPLNLSMDIAAVAGVITPAMLDLGRLHGLSEVSVALSVAMAGGLIFLPYQSAPFMVAYSFRRVAMGSLVLAMVCISLLSLLFLCPLNLLYWHWMGWL